VKRRGERGILCTEVLFARDHRTSAGSRFNSDERLPFALLLFAEQSHDPRAARARTSCGILMSGGRITIPVLCALFCRKREKKRERENSPIFNESLVFIDAFTYAEKLAPTS